MKGKDIYTSLDIVKLRELVNLRISASSSDQKTIRRKMRNLGFYGQDDWGIKDLQQTDIDRLIRSGTIKIIDNQPIATSANNQMPLVTVNVKKVAAYADVNNLALIIEKIAQNRFDPLIDNETEVDNLPGNYILCLKEGSTLPKINLQPIFKRFKGLKVIYTGVASKSLRVRDYKQHFKGNNAGRSTIRKSLGVLFGYKQIPRDKDSNSTKTKFYEIDEKILTDWMHTNLVMFFLPNPNFIKNEIELINEFNPPLNLKSNQNSINKNFRQLISDLRNPK